MTLPHPEERDTWLRLAAMVRPRPPVRPSAWAEQNVRLTSEQSPARPGPFRCDFRPWTRAIHDVMFDHPGKRGVVCVKMAQMGFTQAVMNILGCYCLTRPGPMLYLIGDDVNSKHYVSKYFEPTVRGCPALAQAFDDTADTERSVMQSKSFTGGRIDFAGGGSPGKVSSRPYTIAMVDELEIVYDNFPVEAGDPVGFVKRRLDTVKDTSELWIFSHPRRSDFGIWLLYETWSDMRAWMFDCPRDGCGAPVDPTWGCIHFEGLLEAGPKSLDVTRIDPAKAVFRCPTCRDVITDGERCRLVWSAREGGSGRFVSRMSETEAAAREYVGLHIDGLADPTVTVGALARELAECSTEEQTRTFFNLGLGEKLDSASEAVTVEHVREVLKASEGKVLVPGGRLGCQFAAVGVDVQAPEFQPTMYCRAECYGPMAAKFITSFEKLSGFDALAEWLRFYEVPFAHESGNGVGGKFGISICSIDCAWPTGRVLDFCRRTLYSAATGAPITLLPVRYQPHIKAATPAVMPSEVKRTDSTRPYLGAQERYDLHRDTWVGREMKRWQEKRVYVLCPKPADLEAHITGNVQVPPPDIHGWKVPGLIWELKKNARDDWMQAGAYCEVGAVLKMNLDRLMELASVPEAPGGMDQGRGGEMIGRVRTRSGWFG